MSGGCKCECRINFTDTFQLVRRKAVCSKHVCELSESSKCSPDEDAVGEENDRPRASIYVYRHHNE